VSPEETAVAEPAAVTEPAPVAEPAAVTEPAPVAEPAAVTEPVPVPPHIVSAARHVLARDGLAAATLERISAAAGVSRMTLHRRGVSKRDILRAVAAGFEAEYREAMFEALVARGDARARLQRALELQCELAEANLAALDALSASAREAIFHEPGPGALTRSVFVEPLERLLLDGAADGSLDDVDARETATVLFSTVAHSYRHLRTGHGWRPERARAGVVALVLKGLIARK
jgi:AcrR family transcriptional regulator